MQLRIDGAYKRLYCSQGFNRQFRLLDIIGDGLDDLIYNGLSAGVEVITFVPQRSVWFHLI